MKYAIIQSGGKQYRCEEGGTVEVDRLPLDAGAEHAFQEVLLVANGDNITVGAPLLKDVQVKATVLEQIKGPKLIVFHYKAKERQRKKTGHRQKYTRLKIEKIEG
jgi:large subunit ribosomal protein L21